MINATTNENLPHHLCLAQQVEIWLILVHAFEPLAVCLDEIEE
jgi:hypothetical protein